MVRLGRMQTRAWSPVRREKEAGRRENQDRGTDTEPRAARAMAEARQAGMEEGSREKGEPGQGDSGTERPELHGPRTRAWSLGGRKKEKAGERQRPGDGETHGSRDGASRSDADSGLVPGEKGEGRRGKDQPGPAGLVEAGMGPSMADADARQPRVEGRRRRERDLESDRGTERET